MLSVNLESDFWHPLNGLIISEAVEITVHIKDRIKLCEFVEPAK